MVTLVVLLEHVQPRTNTQLATGNKAFSVTVPSAWNSLSSRIRSIDSKRSFCKQLKTCLFALQYTATHLSGYCFYILIDCLCCVISVFNFFILYVLFYSSDCETPLNNGRVAPYKVYMLRLRLLWPERDSSVIRIAYIIIVDFIYSFSSEMCVFAYWLPKCLMNLWRCVHRPY